MPVCEKIDSFKGLPIIVPYGTPQDEIDRFLKSGFEVIISNSRPGNPYDNAVIESFHKTIKTELIYVEKFDSIEKAKNAIFEYIEMYYNTKRLHSSLGYLSPIQFEIKNC